MELLLFYKYSFVVAALSSAGLSIIGKHNLSRGKVLEIFFLAQFAILGNLVSKLVVHSHEQDLTGIVFSYLFFGVGKFCVNYISRSSLRIQNFDPYMIGGYLFLMALQYLIIGFYPQLDAHMSIGLFGNMVTASFLENNTLTITFLFFVIIYIYRHKQISKSTFEINVLNSKDSSSFQEIIFAIPLITSLYSLGFLYTMSFLLLPGLIIGASFSSEKKSSVFIMICAVLSSILGLFLSIAFENISTTSVQICLLFFFLLGLRFLTSLQKSSPKHTKTTI